MHVRVHKPTRYSRRKCPGRATAAFACRGMPSTFLTTGLAFLNTAAATTLAASSEAYASSSNGASSSTDGAAQTRPKTTIQTCLEW